MNVWRQVCFVDNKNIGIGYSGTIFSWDFIPGSNVNNVDKEVHQGRTECKCKVVAFGFTNQDAALEYYVKSIKARYIRLTIPDDGGNSTVAAIRELDVKGTIIN